MKRIKLFQALSLCLMLCAKISFGDINAIVHKSGTQGVMGVMVRDLTTGRTVYEYNADKLFVPGSSLKIYTGSAALFLLGPKFKFNTELYTNARSWREGILEGNLYVRFSGDPTLTRQDVIQLMQSLQKLGINRIRGKVIIIPPLYTRDGYVPGSTESDRQKPFGAPVTPVIIDQNVLTFTIHTTRPGALVNVVPLEPHIIIINHLYTKRPGSHCGLSYHVDNLNRLELKGCVPASHAGYVERIALVNSLSYAANVMQTALSHWGIRYQNPIMSGAMPAIVNLRKLGQHDSEPLATILANTLKPSNNLFANALYFRTGLTYWRKAVNWESSGLAIKEILQKYAGVQMDRAEIHDGAGLSRMDRVTPRQSIQLLTAMHSQFNLSDAFISALPVPGERGTLVHRYIQAPLYMQKHLHAKTGTLKGVTSLSGYLMSANHHVIAFSMMTNASNPKVYQMEVPLPLWKYRTIENEICAYLMKTST